MINMKQAALMIFITLVVLVGGTVFLNKQLIKQPSLPTPNNQLEQTLETIVKPTLTLMPQNTQVRVGDRVVYSVRIDSVGNQVVGVETYFTYNPDILTNIAVNPSDFFTKADELLNYTDPVQGKISYALGTLTPQSGAGEVFTITATVVATPDAGESIIAFDQNNTKVALLGPDGNTRFDESQTQVQYKEVPLSVLSL